MPVTLNNIGIQSLGITLAESVEVSAKVEAKPLLDKDGKFADGAAFDPTSDFSIKGKGDLPAGLAVGSSHTVPPGLRPIVVLDQIEARGIRAERLA